VTTDGGATWRAGVVPGAETLQFRDVQAVSEGVAYLLAAGQGSNSRIYKTENGGRNWTLQFVAPDDPSYFYDCFAFWTPERGITMADGINATGQFPGIRTTDGKKWKSISLPAAQKDEGAFAASGTCVATLGETRAWNRHYEFRVFASSDRGERWASYLTPIAGGTGSSGVFTVAFRDGRHGVIGGGDFSSAKILDNFARSRDGGKTWHLTPQAPVRAPSSAWPTRRARAIANARWPTRIVARGLAPGTNQSSRHRAGRRRLDNRRGRELEPTP